MSHSEMSACAICGKTYKTCLSCKSMHMAKPWRSITDTAECYKIFLVLTQFHNGHLSADEAVRQLERISYDMTALKESVQNEIAEIMAARENTSEKTANAVRA